MNTLEIPKGDLIFVEDSSVFIIKFGQLEIINHGENFLNPSLTKILGIPLFSYEIIYFSLEIGDYISTDLIKINFKKPDEVFFKCTTKVEVVRLEINVFNVFFF